MPTPDPASAVVDLTRELIAINSVSPSLAAGAPGEREIVAFVADRLASAGFTVTIVQAATDSRRPSVVAVREGTRPGRTVVLNGHLDTVGVDGMTDPFGARIEGDKMFGRGTSDMKGGVAGLIVAAEMLAAADAPGRLIVALVSDEEDASVGATAVLEHLSGETMHICLIAEPTWLDFAVAHRGYAVIRVSLTGRSAHSSQPEEAIDVIPPIGELLTALARHNATLQGADAHPLVSYGSLMATLVRAGVAPFTVAATGEVLIERRTVPGEPENIALDEAQTLVGELTSPAGPKWTIEPVLARSAWQMDASGAAQELVAHLDSALTATGAATPGRIGAPYWMESALWQEAGVPTVVCGPAGGGLHAIDEWVDLAQLRRYPVAVANAVGRFLATTNPLP